MSTIGASVPEDLFDLILDFFEIGHGSGSRSHVTVQKGELGRVALVCRHWAKICQAKIFDRLTLRSRQDALDLCSFMDRPGSVIPSSLRALVLQPDPASAPFIHLVCQKIRLKTLRQDFSLTVVLEGQGVTGTRTQPVLGRSIHHALPTPPLLAFSLGIRELELADVRFESLRDFARLVAELPSLEKLACHCVTWAPLPDSRPYLPSHIVRRSQKPFGYAMSYCTDDCAAVLFSSQIVPARRLNLRSRDAGVMYCLSRILARGQACVNSNFVFNNESDSGGERRAACNPYQY